MHYFQQRYLRENRAFPNLAGLETIDLPNKGLLSGIEMRVWGKTPADTDSPDVWFHDRLKKVELIVNGSQVVKSYDARQLLAMMLYKRTPHYSHEMKNANGVSSEELFYINLGRHYHDPEYMLDLSKVSDPELRLEYDFEMATQNGWNHGKAMTDKPSYNIICHLLRDTALVPKGYIKTSEIYRFENGVSKQENMLIPRGPMYSNLYLQSWYYAMGLATILDHYEVNFNSDALIPIRTRIQELLAELTRMYGLFEMTQEFYGLGGQAYPWPLEIGAKNGTIRYGTADVDVRQDNLWGAMQHTGLRKVSNGALSTESPYMQWTTRGMLPFSVAAIPLFWPWDEETWIDSSTLGDFWLRMEETAGATAGTCKLLADEVVTKYTTPSYPG